jgi:hypothetical protein
MFIELAIAVGSVWFALCLFVADHIATRRWQHERMAQRAFEISRR